MEACAAWTRGQRFADVLNLAPDVFEGSLVRAVRRLEELLRQVRGGEGRGRQGREGGAGEGMAGLGVGCRQAAHGRDRAAAGA
jgi:hypothetical protein